MADDNKPSGRARTQDDVGVTFVNRVMGSGVLNGVLNVTLGTFNFMPSRDVKKIEPDLVVSCRLRLDVFAAMELREAIDRALAMVSQPEPQEQQEQPHDTAALN